MIPAADPALDGKIDAQFREAMDLFGSGELRRALSILEGGDDAWFVIAYPYAHEIRMRLMAQLGRGSPDWLRMSESDKASSERFYLIHGDPALPTIDEDHEVHVKDGEHHYLDDPSGSEDLVRDAIEETLRHLSKEDARFPREDARSFEHWIEREGEAADFDRGGELGGRRWYEDKDLTPSEGRRSSTDFDSGGPLVGAAASATSDQSIVATVERTPHIGISGPLPLQPGSDFKIRVYLDSSDALQGETVQKLIAEAGSNVEATVITSSHFRLRDDPTSTFTLRTEDLRTEVSELSATVTPMEDWTDGIAFIGALFFVDGRPCGKVTREVEVVGRTASSAEQPKDIVAVPGNGGSIADLTVTIIADPSNDGRSYWCSVSTPHIEKYRRRVTGPWNLQSVTQQMVRGFMDRFTAAGTPRVQLISELKGVGMVLFDASPVVFREVFWALIDAKAPLETIAIVSAEPFVPWELMVPYRALPNYERRLPLGVEFSIGRWTDEKTIAPSRSLNIVDSSVIAPAYSGTMVLAKSLDEAQMVISQYPGEIIRPAPFASVGKELGTVSRSLIHFVCHGKDTTGGIQSIRLDNNDELSSTNILGIEGLGELFAKRRPVVFLNACEVGRITPSLVGLGGFVASFIKLGATAVIAPLWSVEDTIAHEIATEFYQEIKKDPTRRVSEIFKKIRTKGYDPNSGKDTYVAYCFYGDPGARLATGETS